MVFESVQKIYHVCLLREFKNKIFKIDQKPYIFEFVVYLKIANSNKKKLRTKCSQIMINSTIYSLRLLKLL